MEQRQTLGKEDSNKKCSRDSERETKGCEDKAVYFRTLPLASDKT